MKGAADNTAGAEVEGWNEPFGRRGQAPAGGIREDESDEPRGYLYQIPNTFLRRCVVVVLTLAACLVTAVVTAAFSLYAAAISAGAAAREFADEFSLHFHGTRRAVRVARLAFMLAWDREAVSNPDAARERMRALSKRWRK